MNISHRKYTLWSLANQKFRDNKYWMPSTEWTFRSKFLLCYIAQYFSATLIKINDIDEVWYPKECAREVPNGITTMLYSIQGSSPLIIWFKHPYIGKVLYVIVKNPWSSKHTSILKVDLFFPFQRSIRLYVSRFS